MSLDRIEQARYRANLIEHLRLLASADEQRVYQRSVPVAQVSAELFESWYDLVPDQQAIENFQLPVFTPEERQALREAHTAVERVADRMAKPLPAIDDFIDTPLWRELASAAAVALEVFDSRGPSPADIG